MNEHVVLCGTEHVYGGAYTYPCIRKYGHDGDHRAAYRQWSGGFLWGRDKKYHGDTTAWRQ